MLITNTGTSALLPKMGMRATAYDLLHVLMAEQAPGGEIPLTQKEIAEEHMHMAKQSVSRAMQELVRLGLVLRSGRRYHLHPLIAGYESEESMRNALARTINAIAAGALPDIHSPYGVRPPRKAVTPNLAVA